MKQFYCKPAFIPDIKNPAAPGEKIVTVLDNSGNPLQSVHVVNGSAQYQTITNASGVAHIISQEIENIIFSHIGKETLSIPFRSLTNRVILEDSVETLEDVVITDETKGNKAFLWLMGVTTMGYFLFKKKKLPKKVNL